MQRKRKQAKTNQGKPHKKGYKLHGLTRSEGSQRAKKAWQTKRSRYRYGLKKRKFAAKDFDEDPLEQLAKHDIEEYEFQMARRFASGQELDDPLFQAYFKNLPHSEKEAFLQKLQKAKEFEKRVKIAKPQEDTIHVPDLADPKKVKLEQGEVNPGEYGTKRVEINAVKRLGEAINKEPKQGETISSTKKESVMKHLHTSVNTIFTMRDPNVVKAREDAKTRPRGKGTASASSVRADVPPERMKGRNLVSYDDRQKLINEIYISHYGKSVSERQSASNSARRRLSRMAVEAQHNYETYQERDAILSAAKDLKMDVKTRAEKPSVVEKRLVGAETAEQMYERSGHATPRPVIKNTKEQIKFHKEIARNKASAIREGRFTRFFGKGKVTTPEEADFAVIPNKVWRYQLALPPEQRTLITSHRIQKVGDLPTVDIHPGEPIEKLRKRYPDLGEKEIKAIDEIQKKSVVEKDLEYWDVSSLERNRGVSRFHKGKRDLKGQLYPGDWDEVISESLEPKYNQSLNFLVGQRGLSQKKELGVGIEKEIFIERQGLKKPVKGPEFPGETSHVEHHIRTSDGGWAPVDKATYDITPERLGTDKQGRPYGAPARRRLVYKKNVQVTYVPPGTTELLKKEKDSVQIVVPKTSFKGKKIAGEHVLVINADESTRAKKVFSKVALGPAIAAEQRKKAEIETVLEGSIGAKGQIIEDKYVVGKLKSNEDFQRRVKDELLSRNPKMSDDEATSHIKELIAAGGTAALFSTSERVRKGYVPAAVNRAFSPFGVTAMDVKEAYVRPVFETASNLKYTVRHPLSSPTGEWGGLQLGDIKYRQHFITPDKRYERLLDYRGEQIARIDRTLDAARRAHGETGFKGAAARWSSERAKRASDYGHFINDKESVVGLAKRDAERVLDPFNPSPFIRTRSGDYIEPKGLHRKTMAAASRLAKQADDMEKKYVRDLEYDQKASQIAKAMSLQPRSKGALFPKGSRWLRADLTKNEKGALIAGGVVASSVGAAYLYHRHQEKKKAENERVAFYNKILPPAFRSPIPTPGFPRVTESYRIPKTTFTEELLISGNKIPARVFIPVTRKRIAFRPSDKGYGQNLPVGMPRFSLTGAATKSGKTRDAFLVDMERAAQGGSKRFRKSDKRSISFLGKQSPFYAEIGSRQKIKLSKKNPNKLSQQDIEKIVWAHMDKDMQIDPNVKNFYGMRSDFQRLLDPRELERIRKTYGTKEAKEFQRKSESSIESTDSFISKGGRSGDRIVVHTKPLEQQVDLALKEGAKKARAEIVKDLNIAKIRGEQKDVEHAKDMLDSFDKGIGRLKKKK